MEKAAGVVHTKPKEEDKPQVFEDPTSIQMKEYA
jgi:hypothetical protein